MPATASIPAPRQPADDRPAERRHMVDEAANPQPAAAFRGPATTATTATTAGRA